MTCLTLEELRSFYQLFRMGHKLTIVCSKFKIDMVYGSQCLAAARELWGSPVPKVVRAKREMYEPSGEPLVQFGKGLYEPWQRRPPPHCKRGLKPVKQIVRFEVNQPAAEIMEIKKEQRAPAIYSNRSPMGIASTM